MTSRNDLIKLQWNTIDVAGMDHTEARQLLHSITDITTEIEGAASELLKSLGYLPLAIDQAASYIRTAQISIAEYLKLYLRERSEYLKEYPSTQYNFQSQETVMTTWTISFKIIKKDFPEVALLLQMLSLLQTEDIPISIIESCLVGQYYWASEWRVSGSPER
jgi:hypothetical protein